MPLTVNRLNQLLKATAAEGWALEIDHKDFSEADLEGIGDQFFPFPEDIFRAFAMVSPCDINYVVLGQDPYFSSLSSNPDLPVATGVAFGVQDENEVQQSLSRILYKIYPDGWKGRNLTNLEQWSKSKGVLLLNAALTVPRPAPDQNPRKCAGKHLKFWAKFTGKVLNYVAENRPDAQMIAFGKPARKALNMSALKPENVHGYDHPVASTTGARSFSAFWNGAVGKLIVR